MSTLHHAVYSQYVQDPDAILVVEFQKGNRASFDSLIRKYYTRVFNFHIRLCNNREVSEDLTQKVFMDVYKQVNEDHGQSSFFNLMFSLAAAKVNFYFKNYRPDSSRVPVNNSNGYDSSADSSPAIVRKAVQSLPFAEQVALLLKRYEQCADEDIAEIMGASLDDVRTWLCRARISLRQNLGKALNIK